MIDALFALQELMSSRFWSSRSALDSSLFKWLLFCLQGKGQILKDSEPLLWLSPLWLSPACRFSVAFALAWDARIFLLSFSTRMEGSPTLLLRDILRLPAVPLLQL